MGGYIGATAVGLTTTAADVQGDITSTDTTPELILKNTSEEDTEGGREGKITFKGEQSGGEESTLAQIQASHDGTSDDEKGDLIFKTNDGSDGASPTERMRIDSAGNVGIGVAPKVTNATVTRNLKVDRTGILVRNSEQVYFNTNQYYDSSDQLKSLGSGYGVALGMIPSDGSARFFTTTASAGSADANLTLSETMRIDSSGNVGINDTTPSHKLDVNGNIAVSQGSRYYLTNDSGFSPNITNTDASNAMQFSTGNAERMRIDSSGNLLLGVTTSPSNSGAVFEGGANPILNIGGTSTSNTGRMRFRNPNGIVGSITTSGSSTAYNTSSDYRLKENVTDVTDGITRVKQLAPKRFNFIADADTTVDGFLAHEAATVVPEAVTGAKDAMRDEEYEVSAATGDIYTPATEEAEEVIHSTDVAEPETLEEGQQWRETTAAVMGTRTVPDYQGIDQSKLVPLLTAALQEAIAKIETLETKVEALEGA